MKVRRAGLVLALVGLSAAAWFWWPGARGPAELSGPIVLVSIDTLRADRLPVYGYAATHTPAIDALAADGVLFEQAWAHAPQTLPSHASIFTGRLPFEHGVRDNLGFVLKPGEPTLASMLRARGFATGGFVSAYVMRGETGLSGGFDTYDDRLPPASPEVAIGEVQRDGQETVASALKWLEAQQSPRFFVFLHLYEPHTPYEPPVRFREFKPYDGEVAYSDELTGRLIAGLRDRGLYDRSLIVVLSDHGEGLGDHGEQEHGLFLYSETTRVPLIIKLPGQREAGRRVEAPAQHIDLLPTVLDFLHAPGPQGLRGRSLVPALSGQTIPEQGIYAEALYARFHFAWSELYSLTDARYRFIRAPRDELYDLEIDRGERENVAGSREPTRIAMRQALEQLMAGAKIDEPAKATPEDRERLKALGYVGMQATVGTQPGADSLPDPKDKVQVLEQYRRALELVRTARPEEAVTALRGIAGENPGMADVWSELGGLLLRLGRTGEAIEAYQRLVVAAPHDPSGLVTVAQLLVQSGKLDEARAQATAALTTESGTDPRWKAAAHKVLMRIALERGDLTGARAEAARAQEADPSIPLPDFVEGLIRYNTGRFNEALPYFAKAAAASAQRTFQVPDLHYYLGDILARQERFDEAERELSLEVRLFPSNLRARSAKAMLYRAQGRNEDADREIESMLRATPSPEAYGLAVKLWTMFGEPEKAQAARARQAALPRAAAR